MISVELTKGEWDQVLGILAMAPWRDANPLLMKIGEQLRLRQPTAQAVAEREFGSGNAGSGALKQ